MASPGRKVRQGGYHEDVGEVVGSGSVHLLLVGRQGRHYLQHAPAHPWPSRDRRERLGGGRLGGVSEHHLEAQQVVRGGGGSLRLEGRPPRGHGRDSDRGRSRQVHAGHPLGIGPQNLGHSARDLEQRAGRGPFVQELVRLLVLAGGVRSARGHRHGRPRDREFELQGEAGRLLGRHPRHHSNRWPVLSDFRLPVALQSGTGLHWRSVLDSGARGRQVVFFQQGGG